MAKSDKDKKIEALEKEIGLKEEEIQRLNTEMKVKSDTIDDYLSTMKMIQADFENYKKRVEREKEKALFYSKEDIIVNLLDMKDNFERAFLLEKSPQAIDDFYKGFEMIYNQLCKLLVDEGVKEIECINMEFDPYYHEALMMDENGEGDREYVCREFQKGYILKDKVIRHSKVSVKKGNKDENGDLNG
ncbi:MAG: nucleotide exchange factor GrpE [Candidatus Methanofastidiosa archaeon]|nr:nucleotide exchange factor GrpE [Candidatus Methanofastidiosa archaeon]